MKHPRCQEEEGIEFKRLPASSASPSTAGVRTDAPDELGGARLECRDYIERPQPGRGRRASAPSPWRRGESPHRRRLGSPASTPSRARSFRAGSCGRSKAGRLRSAKRSVTSSGRSPSRTSWPTPAAAAISSFRPATSTTVTPAVAREHPARHQGLDADESGDHLGCGRVEHAGRLVELHDLSAHQHRHAVAERLRLAAVVRDQHGGDAIGTQDGAEIREQLGVRRGVEAGERLVEQQHLRLEHERAGQRHALGLAPRERPRPLISERRDAEPLEPAPDAPAALVRGAAESKAERQVLGHDYGSCRPGAGAGPRSPCAAARRARAARARVDRARGRESILHPTAPCVGWLLQQPHDPGQSTSLSRSLRHRQHLARRERLRRAPVRPGRSRVRRLCPRPPARRPVASHVWAGRGSNPGGSRTPSAGRARSRGSRRRAAGLRPRGRSRPAPANPPGVSSVGAGRHRAEVDLADDAARASGSRRWAASGEPRSLPTEPDILRPDGNEGDGAVGGGGKDQRVGEFTELSSMSPRQAIWNAGSGTAFTTVPVSTLRIAMRSGPATASDAGCHRELGGAVRTGMTRPPSEMMIWSASRESLGEVVGHEDRGGPPPAQDRPELVAQRATQRRVQRRQRLVEQEQRRIDRQRPPEGHALTLASLYSSPGRGGPRSLARAAR